MRTDSGIRSEGSKGSVSTSNGQRFLHGRLPSSSQSQASKEKLRQAATNHEGADYSLLHTHGLNCQLNSVGYRGRCGTLVNRLCQPCWSTLMVLPCHAALFCGCKAAGLNGLYPVSHSKRIGRGIMMRAFVTEPVHCQALCASDDTNISLQKGRPSLSTMLLNLFAARCPRQQCIHRAGLSITIGRSSTTASSQHTFASLSVKLPEFRKELRQNVTTAV